MKAITKKKWTYIVIAVSTIASLGVLVYFKDSGKSFFDVLTAVAPIWALIIAISIPQLDKLQREIDREQRINIINKTVAAAVRSELETYLIRMSSLGNLLDECEDSIAKSKNLGDYQPHRPFADSLPTLYVDMPADTISLYSRKEAEFRMAAANLEKCLEVRNDKAVRLMYEMQLKTVCRYLVLVAPNVYEKHTVEEIMIRIEQLSDI